MSEIRPPMVGDHQCHELKVWPMWFILLKAGVKRFELRRNDRGFKPDDYLWLREFLPEEKVYTGRQLFMSVTMVFGAGEVAGLQHDFCVMGVSKVDRGSEHAILTAFATAASIDDVE